MARREKKVRMAVGRLEFFCAGHRGQNQDASRKNQDTDGRGGGQLVLGVKGKHKEKTGIAKISLVG